MANKTRETTRVFYIPTSCIHFVVVDFLLVTFEVEGQVVGAGETAFAMNALERFGARVFAVMAGQLV
jgi:hypothetical protein